MSDSNKINDGGPAFPQHGWSSSPEVIARTADRQGMSLRDWFAGQCLAGISSISQGDGDTAFAPLDAAIAAYKFADQMIAAREAKP